MNCRVCGSALPNGAIFCGVCGSSVTSARNRPAAVPDARPSDTSVIERLPGPAVAGRFPERAGEPDAEHVPDREYGEPVSHTGRHARLVTRTFTFSTGETVIVHGSGLIGRRPITQPTESVDHLIAIADPTRSVSKTHIEFGFEGDDLWISDRYSGNGTVVHPRDSAARQLEPGRRFRVTHGARVEIGDQYFDVS